MRRSAATVVLAALAAAAPAGATLAARSAPRRAALSRSLASSRERWATVDVCNPGDQPDTVGIRGSMPGDGHGEDRMYMSFRLQMRDRRTGAYRDLGPAGAFLAVGAGGSPRQGGTSFVIRPVSGQPPLTLRGLVQFQWRRGGTVIASASRTTTAGHRSLAGADPASYSAASCLVG